MNLSLSQLPIPRRSLGLLVALVGISVAILVVLYLPMVAERGDLELQLAQLRDESRAAQIMTPVRAQLERAEAYETEFEVMLRDIEPALQTVSVDAASQVLASLAARHALGNANFTPIPTSLLAQRGELLVEGRMVGSLADFRSFLLSLLASTAVQGLERIEVQSRDGQPEFRVRIWFLVE